MDSQIVSGLIGVGGVLAGILIQHLVGARARRGEEDRTRGHELRVLIARVQGYVNRFSYRVRVGPELARLKLGWAAPLLNRPEDLVPRVWAMYVEEAKIDFDELGARLDLAGYLDPGAIRTMQDAYQTLEDGAHRHSEPSYVLGWAARYVAALQVIAVAIDKRFDFHTVARRGSPGRQGRS